MDFINRVNLGTTYQWNPWYGCSKISEACDNCFIKHQNSFVLGDYDFSFRLESAAPGSVIITSLNTDFFLEEGDAYRDKAWEVIHNHPDLIFLLITKRIHRVEKCLPSNWGDGYENVIIDVTVENQKWADIRIPILQKLTAKHKWITCSPLLESINVEKYLNNNFIEHVECCGETGKNELIRELKYEWVENLSKQCKKYNVRFSFMKIGHKFNKNDYIYSEYCTCYHSQVADILNLDNNIPMVFNLKSMQKIF